MTAPRNNGIFRDIQHKCKFCLRPGVPLLNIEMTIFEKDGKTVMNSTPESRRFRGCQECLDEMGNYVKWSLIQHDKRVGTYVPNRSKKPITKEVV
jgi:hypothetical protein